jgi:hypothetical protein
MAEPIVETTVQPVTPPAGGETVESLKSQLEAEQAKRIIAESEATNAKKDVIAIKTGRKREEIDLNKEVPVVEAPKTEPNAELLAELAEAKRVNAELLRASKPGLAPAGGGGFAESPAPKPQGFWGENKRAALKARGWSDEKIARAEKTAQTGTAQSPKSHGDVGIERRKY